MTTIPKNATRKIATLKTELTDCRRYSLSGDFRAQPCDPKYAWDALQTRHAKLTTDDGLNPIGGGHSPVYTISVHSNLWYELRAPAPPADADEHALAEAGPVGLAAHLTYWDEAGHSALVGHLRDVHGSGPDYYPALRSSPRLLHRAGHGLTAADAAELGVPVTAGGTAGMPAVSGEAPDGDDDGPYFLEHADCAKCPTPGTPGIHCAEGHCHPGICVPRDLPIRGRATSHKDALRGYPEQLTDHLALYVKEDHGNLIGHLSHAHGLDWDEFPMSRTTAKNRHRDKHAEATAADPDVLDGLAAEADRADAEQGRLTEMATPAASERVYRMGGDLVPESGMKRWHNDRGRPWGTTFEGPDPVTMSRQVAPGNITVHLANEHGINPDLARCLLHVEHAFAHVHGKFRAGQAHYHNES